MTGPEHYSEAEKLIADARGERNSKGDYYYSSEDTDAAALHLRFAQFRFQAAVTLGLAGELEQWRKVLDEAGDA